MKKDAGGMINWAAGWARGVCLVIGFLCIFMLIGIRATRQLILVRASLERSDIGQWDREHILQAFETRDAAIVFALVGLVTLVSYVLAQWCLEGRQPRAGVGPTEIQAPDGRITASPGPR